MDNFDDEETMTTKITSLEGQDDNGAPVLRKQVADWTKERDRLQDQIDHATGASPLSQPHQSVVAAGWQPMRTAPKDGTIVRLLVDFTDNATEDGEGPYATIGANCFDHDEQDEWKFAGWDWQQDCFTEGVGTPLFWKPMDDAPLPPAPAPVERAETTQIYAVDALTERMLMAGIAGMAITLDHMQAWNIAKALQAAATPSLPVGQALDLAAMTDERIEAIWNALDGKAIITGENQLNWNAALRKAFARAIIRALRSAPDNPAACDQKHLPGWERGIATVTLDGHQLREALEFINPDGADDPDQRDDWLTFGIVKHKADDGTETTGMCCWNDDSDGVLPLDGAPVNPVSENGGSA